MNTYSIASNGFLSESQEHVLDTITDIPVSIQCEADKKL